MILRVKRHILFQTGLDTILVMCKKDQTILKCQLEAFLFDAKRVHKGKKKCHFNTVEFASKID